MSESIMALQLFSLFILYCSVQSIESGPIVNSTKLGVIRGLQATDGDYHMYLGIPYAVVNTTNPFGPTLPAAKFTDGFNAFDGSTKCPQIDKLIKAIVGNLNCLHVNIYIPNSANPNENPLPVLIWIYGGAHVWGYAIAYGPKFLMRHEIIFVTFDYRVGPYGNMCLGIPEAPCNGALRDQMQALKWVHDNIEEFGGDPSKITLYGGSSGSADVDLLLTKEENNFIDKAIMTSGSIKATWYLTEPDKEAPFKLSKYYGFNTSDVREALYFLANIEPKSLIKAVKETDVKFGPSVERKTEEFDNLITEYPIHLKPKVNLSAVMLGYNEAELFFNSFMNISDLRSDLRNKFLDLETVFKFDESNINEIKNLLYHFYIDDDTDATKEKLKITHFGEDTYYLYPAEMCTQKYIEHGVKNIYRYLFTHNGELKYNTVMTNITYDGAAHGDEMAYIMDINIVFNHTNEKGKRMVDIATTLWANFVKYGDPTPVTTDLLPVKWPPISATELPCMNLNLNMSLIHRPFHRRMAFYDLFFEAFKEYYRRAENNLKSRFHRILRTMVLAPLLLAGLNEEKQQLQVELFSDFEDDQDLPVTDAYVEVQSRFAQVYACELHIEAHFQGLRYLMFHWPKMSALVGISTNLLFVSLIFILSWYHLQEGLPDFVKFQNKFGTEMKTESNEKEDTTTIFTGKIKLEREESSSFFEEDTFLEDLPQLEDVEKTEVESKV